MPAKTKTEGEEQHIAKAETAEAIGKAMAAGSSLTWMALHDMASILLWKFLFTATCFLANVAAEQVPQALRSFIRSLVVVFISSQFLRASRWFVFEVIYKNKAYVTKRDLPPNFDNEWWRGSAFLYLWGQPLFEVMYKSKAYVTKRELPPKPNFDNEFWRMFPFLYLWAQLLACIIKDGPLDAGSLNFMSIVDLGKMILLWCVTDWAFFIQHWTAHTPKIYAWLHKTHHSLAKPSAFLNDEKFTMVDGSLHMVSYYVASTVVGSLIEVSPDMWLLGAMQWLVVGQFMHGGKDVPVTMMPGLHAVMRICGVKSNMSLLHEKHHAVSNGNYSMMGIADRLFGTSV